MFEKLSMVTRIVTDQEEALTFYRDTLGFEVTHDRDGPHGRFVSVAPESGDSADLILVTPDMFDGEKAKRLNDRIGTDTGLIYEVDDCLETYEALRERGVPFRDEPEEMPWAIQAVGLDPDGNETVIQESVSPGSSEQY